MVVKQWLIVSGRGGSGKIMAFAGGRRRWRQNYDWLWVVVGGLSWSHNLVMPVFLKKTEPCHL